MTTMIEDETVPQQLPDVDELAAIADPRERIRQIGETMRAALEIAALWRTRRNAAALVLHKRGKSSAAYVWRDVLGVSRSTWTRVMEETTPTFRGQLREQARELRRQAGSPERAQSAKSMIKEAGKLDRQADRVGAVLRTMAELRKGSSDVEAIARDASRIVEKYEGLQLSLQPLRDDTVRDLLHGRTGDVVSNAEVAALSGLTPARVTQLYYS